MLIVVLSTSLLTALAIGITVMLMSGSHARRVMRRKARHFWNNQNLTQLEVHTGQPHAHAPPPARPVFFDHLQVANAANALLKQLVARDGLTRLNYRIREDAGDLAALLGMTTLQARACVDLLCSVGLLKREDHHFVFDAAARVYLSRNSPLCIPDFLPGDARPLPWLRKPRRLNPAAAAWASGRAVNAERWAIYMHQDSFPLGFALHERALLPAGSRVLDVAAGAGSVCVGLALKDPTLELALIELPDSVAFAERLVARYGLGERIACLGRNMFEDEWPDGFDVVIFTNIFHDWDDEKCLQLAHRAFRSLRPGGRVIVQEALLDDGVPTPMKTVGIAYTLAIEFESRQLAYTHVRSLLTTAGFSNVTAQPLVAPFSAVVAGKN